ncbi:IscS subfamily cysteine desulfurase [Chromohalobacter japonicus]|uniref:cysteine desulfurase n=1 Tax=Chromohalobacter japonicus TaxID=223900 RepID=A0A1Q8THV1_9GAMM|nr:aminotransferase class V-fold PLP-dependent enzyme [Chromohalobacter japonicus]OLO13269.1 IscS subfamily cysteine desulfurase [Chromohalobacter japonicus]
MCSQPIYFDYAATTPVDPRVATIMAQCLTQEGTFANPASRSHMLGWIAEQAVERARSQVSELINADPREIVWTSGATEANNLALTGFMRANCKRGRHLVTSTIEHKAVIDTALALETEGFKVTFLTPDSYGRISPNCLKEALRDDTVLVSLMAANNEIGTINDIQRLGEIVREHGAAFHVDAVQAIGKLWIDLELLPVDMMSMTAHKIYGPKGIGALFVRKGIHIEPLIHGGGHERGMRSGTLATHQITGMGEAFSLARKDFIKEVNHLENLREKLLFGLNRIKGVKINNDPDKCVPNIVNVGFEGLDSETLLMALRDFAMSTGSACNSANIDPSYVLTGIGMSRKRALESIRFSFGRYTTDKDIDKLLTELDKILPKLRYE